jgi:hypothetical protein
MSFEYYLYSCFLDLFKYTWNFTPGEIEKVMDKYAETK